MLPGSPAASPDSSDNSDTQHSVGSDMEMDDQIMSGSKRSQQRLSDTEVNLDIHPQQPVSPHHLIFLLTLFFPTIK